MRMNVSEPISHKFVLYSCSLIFKNTNKIIILFLLNYILAFKARYQHESKMRNQLEAALDRKYFHTLANRTVICLEILACKIHHDI